METVPEHFDETLASRPLDHADIRYLGETAISQALPNGLDIRDMVKDFYTRWSFQTL